jgi:hypothetical protein
MDKKMLIDHQGIAVRNFFDKYPLTLSDKNKIQKQLGYTPSAIRAWTRGNQKIQKPVLEYILQEVTCSRYGKSAVASPEAVNALRNSGNKVLNPRAKKILSTIVVSDYNDSVVEKSVTVSEISNGQLFDEKFFDHLLSFEFLKNALTFKKASLTNESRLELIAILSKI